MAQINSRRVDPGLSKRQLVAMGGAGLAAGVMLPSRASAV
jgi:hypothetical protein